MPICVAGMHRSGTSMVARLLREAGLYLGADEEMLPANDGNRDGHWENTRFVEINDRILERGGGAWHVMPNFADGWQHDPAFDDLAERAAALIASFSGREPWGWKDPRNSLTLPFWRRIVPDLKAIVPIRNPLEVADSLAARNRLTTDAGLAIWAEYAARCRANAPRDFLVTHYDAYFADFDAEAERLFAFAGLSPPRESLERLRGLARDDLRHNRRSLADWIDGRYSRSLVVRYLDLCAKAGPVFLRTFAPEAFAAAGQPLPDGEPTGDWSGWYLGRAALRLVDLEKEGAEWRRQIAALEASLDASRRETAEARGDAERLRERLSWRRHRWVDALAEFAAKFRRKGPAT